MTTLDGNSLIYVFKKNLSHTHTHTNSLHEFERKYGDIVGAGVQSGCGRNDVNTVFFMKIQKMFSQIHYAK